MPALYREANLPIPLHPDARQGSRRLLFECLDYVLGTGVLRLAMDSAKTTAHAYFFSDLYLFHSLILIATKKGLKWFNS
jgi:hypothetical protein